MQFRRGLVKADVLVLGGGPSGLLLASYLSRKLKVHLIEKGDLGTTEKFWLTNSARLAPHGLTNCIQFTATRGTVGSFLGTFAHASGDFAVVDDNRLLKSLVLRCRESNVQLVAGEKVLGLEVAAQGIETITSQARYQSRLVVDAMGGGSPVVATFQLSRLDGFYSILGAHLIDIDLKTTDVVGAHVVQLGNPAPLFEVIPTSSSSAYCVIFMATRRAKNPSDLSSLFEQHLQANPFFDFHSSSVIAEKKCGVIPIGRRANRTVPGLLSFGEAAMLHAPLLGTAFNEVLEYAELYAAEILTAFDRDSANLIQASPSLPAIKKINDIIQSIVVSNLIECDIWKFERLTMFLRGLGPQRAYRLFCSQLSVKDLPACTRAWVGARLRPLRFPKERPKHLFDHFSGDH